jgi:hypothetical protein
MTGVFRKKEKAWSKNSIFGYLLHGVTAVLALWMFLNAVN